MTEPHAAPPTSRPETSLQATLQRLRVAHRARGPLGYQARLDALGRLEAVLKRRREAIARAISADFGNRSRHESLLAEVYICLSEIGYVREHLRGWLAPERRRVGAPFLPGRAEVHRQPLGVVGVIAPWNYPIQLAFAPVIAAVAAGNRVMVKPSELVPETAALTAALVGEAFDDDHVAVVTGGPEVGEAFSRLAFDHLLFTGSTRVGKVVMRAAAENLVPVTLELGGKSPVIVAEDHPIEAAARCIMSGKLFNAGQTCIAPDYALVPADKIDAFVEAARGAVARMYPTLGGNPDYTSIINERHRDRLVGYLSEARARGARVVDLAPGGEAIDPATRKLAPAIVLDATDEMALMQDEIFGPILPVRPYTSLGEAIDFVNDRPRPLALYCFTHEPQVVRRVLRETTSGGVTINETMLHVAQDDLPFGGVGPSGMGRYHGREGFETFTHTKGVFHQARVNGTSLLRPPYGRAVEALLKVLIG